jgi:hypothetical protein
MLRGIVMAEKIRIEVDYWLMVFDGVLFRNMTWDTARHNSKLLVKGWRR